MTPKKHLERVLAKVEATFWTRGSLKKPGKNHRFEYCVLGLVELTGGLPQKEYYNEGRVQSRYPEVVSLLAQAASPTKTTNSFNGLPVYDARTVHKKNDHSTKEQVIKWLQRAIQLAEGK